jgi:hypothetical protein
MFLGGNGSRLQTRAPAPFADLIRINKIVGRLATPVAFDGHSAGNAANLQAPRHGLALDPFSELDGGVTV